MSDKNAKKIRCDWATNDPIYLKYHDEEWGIPVHDDNKLFEMLCLEGAQAGLSWITILKKRENYKQAFANFDWHKIATMDIADVNRLMLDAGIIRNRLKIEGFIKNAKAMLKIIEEGKTLNEIIWSFVSDKQKINHPKTLAEIPAISEEAIALSKALKKRGFTFVGPTICYAFMQAVGLVDDHLENCFCKKYKL